jgi:hypothetical protein
MSNKVTHLTPEDVIYLEGYISFTEHYANYVRENNKDIHNRAVDYAMTYAGEDVKGIKFSYIKDENGNTTLDMNTEKRKKNEDTGS